ncbi:MAG: TerC/Alx family metal homeostasis membrane protein [Solirubrobacteraceae bacterium]
MFSADVLPWIGLFGTIAVLLTLDLLVMRGRDGAMSLRQASFASVFWVLIALSFGVVLFLFGDSGDASAYLAGYLVEKSLSLDNVFVFLLVFSAFGIAAREQYRLLTYGIVLALVLRGIFIVAGAALLSAFSWVSLIFAAFLIWTGIRMLRHRHDHDGETELVEKLQRRLPITTAPEAEGKLWLKIDGRRMFTAGGAALIGIAIVDIIFAVDSVPAILAITPDPFIVFAANAFALLGLRPLFFLVAELVERLYYLKMALALLLVFIGAKMVLAEFVGKIGPEYSLPGIVFILGGGVVTSLWRERRLKREAGV